MQDELSAEQDDRDMQVLCMVLRGYSGRDIASALRLNETEVTRTLRSALRQVTADTAV